MKTIPLNGRRGAGRVVLVDDEDYQLISAYRWHVWERREPGRYRTHGPYACGWVQRGDGGGGHLYMHRLITGWPMTDHANGDGLDNRRSNLRLANTVQNGWNSAPRGGATSRFKGVSWHDKSGKWQVYISAEGKRRFLGHFISEEDAGAAYAAAALEVQGQYAYTARAAS